MWNYGPKLYVTQDVLREGFVPQKEITRYNNFFMANFLLRITVSLWHLAFLSRKIMQVNVSMNFGIKYSFFFPDRPRYPGC